MAQRPITVLDEHVANRIAAGEVIERPASAVKELVENALDAGARRVEVEIRGGGKEYIRVTDDGEGIPPAEVPLAFARHATSKIASADDLFAVETLGFRGEALPSIAAVAEVEMRTRTPEHLEGTRYVIVAGRPQVQEPAGAPVGTTVIVRRLFFNTPARYKFLRTEATEKRYVADVVARLAMARPEVAFRLLADGRELLATPGDGRLMSAVTAVYGPHIGRELLPVDLGAEGIEVRGLVGKPSLHHSNRERICVVLNGRWIESGAVARAVEKGYDTLLPPRRFPVAVIHISLDLRSVDVNVHPAKAEVRFRDDSTVFRTVLRAVRQALLGGNLVGGLAPAGLARPTPGHPHGSLAQAPAPPGGRSIPAPTADPWSRGYAAGPIGVAMAREAGIAAPASPGAEAGGDMDAPPGAPPPPGRGSVADAVPDRALAAGAASLPGRGSDTPAGLPDEDAREQLREMTVLGQLYRTYIVGETAAGLWIVDQHVAHERILYEQLRRAAATGVADVQHLLVPVTVTVSPTHVGLVEQFQAQLERLGLVLESFGGRTYLVRGLPVQLAGAEAGEVQGLLEEILTALEAEGGWHPHPVCARMACKGAIKAGQLLEARQMKQLLVDLSLAENPFACPHGRPIIMSVPRAELARRFGRH